MHELTKSLLDNVKYTDPIDEDSDISYRVFDTGDMIKVHKQEPWVEYFAYFNRGFERAEKADRYGFRKFKRTRLPTIRADIKDFNDIYLDDRIRENFREIKNQTSGKGTVYYMKATLEKNNLNRVSKKINDMENLIQEKYRYHN